VNEPSPAQRDWEAWHRAYDGDTYLRRRLVLVQGRIREFLDAAPPGPLRAISVCAGQGRDLLEVLREHPRRGDVAARLVELDPRNVAEARAAAAAAGLGGVEVVEGDASNTSAYAGAVPADLVLLCGVFGNVAEPDIARTIALAPSLCAPGATVLWTRHRRAPDRTPWVRERFASAGFRELGFDAPADAWFSVGAQRLEGEPARFEPGVQLFTFVGFDALLGLRSGAQS
jgi:methyltransferase family protein